MVSFLDKLKFINHYNLQLKEIKLNISYVQTKHLPPVTGFVRQESTNNANLECTFTGMTKAHLFFLPS